MVHCLFTTDLPSAFKEKIRFKRVIQDMTCRTSALFTMMIKLILAILEALCHYPNDLWMSSPQRGLETQSWSLLPKAAKPSIWQKPWALVHPNHRPPTKVGMGRSPTLRVFLLFQRDIYTLLMFTMHMSNAHCRLLNTAHRTAVLLSFIDSHACAEEICKLIGGRLGAQVGVVRGQCQS